MEQPNYNVLSPLGHRAADTSRPLAQLAELNDKTICELDGRAFRANETLAVIRSMLQERYPRAKFVKAGEIFSPSSQDQAAGLREKSLADLNAAFQRHGVDVVITGNGA